MNLKLLHSKKTALAGDLAPVTVTVDDPSAEENLNDVDSFFGRIQEPTYEILASSQSDAFNEEIKMTQTCVEFWKSKVD
jgi:hypothetical protein